MIFRFQFGYLNGQTKITVSLARQQLLILFFLCNRAPPACKRRTSESKTCRSGANRTWSRHKQAVCQHERTEKGTHDKKTTRQGGGQRRGCFGFGQLDEKVPLSFIAPPLPPHFSSTHIWISVRTGIPESLTSAGTPVQCVILHCLEY